MLQLYKNIKNRRTELHLTQSELADKMGYADKSMIAKIEKGLVDLPQSKILAFAEALETTPSYLVGWETNDKIGEPIILGSELNSIFEKLSMEFDTDKNYLISQFFSYDLSNLPKECRILNEKNIRQILENSFSKNLSPATIAAHKERANFTDEELSKIEEYKRLLIAARPKE